MEKTVDKKFGLVIKDFSSLQSDKCYSVPVLISDCKWRLVAFPKGNNCDHLFLYLDVVDCESFPSGWKKYVKFRMTLVNQHSKSLSIMKETEHCFDGKSTTWGFPTMLPLSKLHEKDGGFLVNGEAMILAEVNVFDVTSTLYETEKSELASKKKENVGDFLKETSPGKEIILVNGTKQVENDAKSILSKKQSKTFLHLLKKFMKIVFLFSIFVVIINVAGAVIMIHEMENKKRRGFRF